MIDYTISDYRNAPSGIGPLSHVWRENPHRLVYDLISEIQLLKKEIGNSQHEFELDK